MKNCIEIGCYPGRFLTIFGDKGIPLSGIDYVDHFYEVEQNLKDKGYKTEDFINTDFTTFQSKKKYDLVMSFGFIEHFIDWEHVFQKHIDLVADHGYIIIETPSFHGWFQRIPRKWFYRENYNRHNIHSMILEKWEKLLELNGFEILNAEYFGGYDVWFEENNLSRKKLKQRNRLMKFLEKTRKKLIKAENSKHFSSYLGIMAKKKSV